MHFNDPRVALQRLGLWVLVVAIVLSRLFAFWIFECKDIANDSGVAVKLAGEPAYLDYQTYRAHIQTAWAELGRPLVFFQLLLSDGQNAWEWLKIQPLKPGPVFPALLSWTGYEDSRGLLSWMYYLAGTLLGGIWALWTRARGGAVWLQLLVACFPALVYYSLLVSTDLLFAVVIAAWVACARIALRGRRGAWAWFALATMVALMTRPNALALLPMLPLLAWRRYKPRAWLLWTMLWAVVGVYMLIYYLPYYWVHDSNAGATHYLGLLPADYYRGLWEQWPAWLSRPLSWGILAVVKLMHAVGLRPSYAGLDAWLVIARALPGILLLPGLLYGIRAGSWFERCFVFLFMLPVFVGAAQERYLLAITPLLLLWGVQAWHRMGLWVWHRSRWMVGSSS